MSPTNFVAPGQDSLTHFFTESSDSNLIKLLKMKNHKIEGFEAYKTLLNNDGNENGNDKNKNKNARMK